MMTAELTNPPAVLKLQLKILNLKTNRGEIKFIWELEKKEKESLLVHYEKPETTKR